VFNLAREQAVRSCPRAAALDTHVACFVHSDPVVGRAAAALRESADTSEASH